MDTERFLTPQQLASWQDDGFLVVPDAFSADACEALRARALDMVDGFAAGVNSTVFDTTDQQHGSDEYFLTSGDKIRFFVEEGARNGAGELVGSGDEVINKIGHAMHDLDGTFSDFSRAEPIARSARQIGFHDPRLLQSMYIFKSPRIGGEVSWHTDHTFLWTEPQSVVGFWVAIDDATVENGCMWAIPGGHRQPVRQRFRRSDAGTVMDVLDPTELDTSEAVPLEAPRGTLILLNGSLPHASPPNTSAKPRHAFTLHVIEGSALYPDDNWLRRSSEMPLRGFSD